MMWKVIFGTIGAAVVLAVTNALSEMHLEKVEEEKARKQKEWDQALRDQARRAQAAEEAPQKEAERLRLLAEKEEERLRLQAEADERKDKDLIEKWGPTVLYWEGWLGRDQLFRFKPDSIPDEEHFDAKLIEVQDQGILVRETLGGQTRYLPFEGLNSVLVTPPEEEEDDEDEENEE